MVLAIENVFLCPVIVEIVCIDDNIEYQFLIYFYFILLDILYDTQQVLYRPCAGGNPPCLKPTISYVHKNSCIEHVQLKFDSTEIDNILVSFKEFLFK